MAKNTVCQPVLDKSGGLVDIATKYFPLATKKCSLLAYTGWPMQIETNFRMIYFTDRKV